MPMWVLLLLTAPLAGYMIWHALSIVLSAIARRRVHRPSQLLPIVGKVALLYVTYNDFNPSACLTLLDQDGVDYEIFILDDSTLSSERKRIDEWCRGQDVLIRVIRRSDRSGYKGGNVNHWLALFGDPEVYRYLLLVDADERIPRNFTCRLLESLASNECAFAQGCHLGTAELCTLFQILLHPQVECEWFHQVPARNLLGIPPMLGHGVLLDTRSLQAVGGFPNLVSEDLAFTILLAKAGLTGVIVTNVIGFEEFPRSYQAYWNRRRRWIQADAELVRKLLKPLWQSHIRWLGRLDLSIRELRLSLASMYWALLFLVGVSVFFAPRANLILPTFAWVSLPLFLIPALPALNIKRLSLTKRIVYICLMPFVGAATASVHPVATLQGLLGFRFFKPTGSKDDRERSVFSPLLLWELFSACIFLIGGLLSNNWPLMALGLATGCSPLMRTRWKALILVSGGITFWMLILFQIGIDAVNGFLPIEHLLVLVGLAITLI
jgi:cellulose synthase/poly-beta-1,6-N-acetylglucosamine synthase-like glycosyltransferase